MNTQIEYVVGFLFSNSHLSVVLIEKRKPAWQAGKLNGVGGKIESGEEPTGAMRREFKEETGADVNGWDHFASIVGDWGKLHCFVRILGPLEFIPKITQMESERPDWYEVSDLWMFEKIPNLRWLIPLALDHTSGFVVCQDVVVNNTPELSTSEQPAGLNL